MRVNSPLGASLWWAEWQVETRPCVGEGWCSSDSWSNSGVGARFSITWWHHFQQEGKMRLYMRAGEGQVWHQRCPSFWPPWQSHRWVDYIQWLRTQSPQPLLSVREITSTLIHIQNSGLVCSAPKVQFTMDSAHSTSDLPLTVLIRCCLPKAYPNLSDWITDLKIEQTSNEQTISKAVQGQQLSPVRYKYNEARRLKKDLQDGVLTLEDFLSCLGTVSAAKGPELPARLWLVLK